MIAGQKQVVIDRCSNLAQLPFDLPGFIPRADSMDPRPGLGDSQSRSTEPIYEAAVACLTIFDEYLRRSQAPKQPSKGDEEQPCAEVEELRARFKQWAAYIGAFASARASLDARLALQATTREMVLELLVLIRLNMRWGMS